jgi:hypothetical protein
VEFEYTGNLVPCRGDNTVLYLFNVKGDKLSVWFRMMDDNSSVGSRPGEWLLRDTISLLDTCGHLMKQGGEPLDGQEWEEAVVSIVGVETMLSSYSWSLKKLVSLRTCISRAER